MSEQIDILSAARKYRMFRAGDKVLAAVSGGPDSVAMLHALHTCSDEFGITLHIAHLNHQLRGEQSDLDERFVRDLAHQFGVPATVERVDVASVRRQMKAGEEEAAREVRYRFLRHAAADVGAGKIAVGHTADDRAETVLLNIIRGTGIDGLASIRPIRGNIVRPLIDTYRTEIEAYIKERGLPFRIDESNADTTYARNRVRHELLTLLGSDYNPEVKRALARLAEIAADQSEAMANLASSAAHAVTLGDGLDAGLLRDLPRAVQREILRAEVEKHKGDLKDVTFEQVERVIEALADGEDFSITLPSGRIYAVRAGHEFRVRQKQRPVVSTPFDCPLEIPGKTIIPEIGLVLEAEILEGAEITTRKTHPNEALIDVACVVESLRVRSVRPGDRITPFGMSGVKKLQDVFVDKKIPRKDRANAAVIVDDEKLIWVVGVVVSETGRVTEKTRNVIRICASSIS